MQLHRGIKYENIMDKNLHKIIPMNRNNAADTRARRLILYPHVGLMTLISVTPIHDRNDNRR